jgi:predicted nucleic acid-binding Zn ribbon protein
MIEVHSVCVICGASVPADAPRRGLCSKPCRPQARLERRLVEAALRICDPQGLLVTTSATAGFFLVAACLESPGAFHKLLAYLLCCSVLVHGIGVLLVRRELETAARAKRDLLRRADHRYLRRLAPPRTRCAFCRCDFFRQEVASSCRRCKTLVHAECVGEILDGPGPPCPTYGCSGRPRRSE